MIELRRVASQETLQAEIQKVNLEVQRTIHHWEAFKRCTGVNLHPAVLQRLHLRSLELLVALLELARPPTRE